MFKTLLLKTCAVARGWHITSGCRFGFRES